MTLCHPGHLRPLPKLMRLYLQGPIVRDSDLVLSTPGLFATSWMSEYQRCVMVHLTLLMIYLVDPRRGAIKM